MASAGPPDFDLDSSEPIRGTAFAMLLNGAGGTGPTRDNRFDCAFVSTMPDSAAIASARATHHPRRKASSEAP